MTIPRARHVAALIFAVKGLLLGGCILDFSDLTGGETVTGSGGSNPDGGPGSGGSGGSGDETWRCPLLDCAACAADCITAECVPSRIAKGADAERPWAVAVSGDGVYWVNNGGNEVVRRTTGSKAAEVLTKAVAPIAIAVAGGFVVWAADDGLWGCPADTCAAGKEKISASVGPGTLQGVAFDGQTVYFTDRGDGNLTGKVLRCARDACGAPFEIATGQLAPQGIAINGDSVFWTDRGDGSNNGNVYKASRTGSGYAPIAGPLVLPTAIVADDSHVYFNRWAADGKVLRCSHTGGHCDAPEDIAPVAGVLALPFDLAISGDRIYWSNSGDGAIESCPLAGCAQDPPRVHASGRESLRRIALGSTCLFWVDDTAGGSVFEIPR